MTDQTAEPSDEQLWADLEDAEGAARGDLLHELGGRAFARGDFEQSLTLAEAAAEAFADDGDDYQEGMALYGQGQGLSRLGRTDEAVTAFHRAAELFRQSGSQSDLAACHLRAGWALAHTGRDGEALEEWEAAERLAGAESDGETAGKAAMARGESLGRLGRQPEALAAFEAARGWFRGQAGAPLVAWADDRRAAALIDLGRIAEAIVLLRTCLHVAEVAADEEELAYAAYRLGWTLRIDGSYQESLSCLQQARDLYSEQDDLGGVARCDLEAANCLSRVGQEDEAESLYIRARSVFDALGDDHSALMCDVNRALMYAGLSRIADSAELNRISLARAREAGDEAVRFGLASRLALDLVRLGRVDEAAGLLQEGGTDHPGQETYEQAFRLAVRGRVAVALGDLAGARVLADEGLGLLAGTDHVSVRAELFEVRSDATRDSEPVASERDLAQAVALYLAAGDVATATVLSERFLPKDQPIRPRSEDLRVLRSLSRPEPGGDGDPG